MTDGNLCDCQDWAPCACANQPPYHCMYCCRDLTEEQLNLRAAEIEYWEGLRDNAEAKSK